MVYRLISVRFCVLKIKVLCIFTIDRLLLLLLLIQVRPTETECQIVMEYYVRIATYYILYAVYYLLFVIIFSSIDSFEGTHALFLLLLFLLVFLFRFSSCFVVVQCNEIRMTHNNK